MGKEPRRTAIDEYVGTVYAVERQIKELREERENFGTTPSLETVLKIRRERSASLMAAFKEWVEKTGAGCSAYERTRQSAIVHYESVAEVGSVPRSP